MTSQTRADLLCLCYEALGITRELQDSAMLMKADLANLKIELNQI